MWACTAAFRMTVAITCVWVMATPGLAESRWQKVPATSNTSPRDPVVLVHGLGSSIDAMRPLARQLSRDGDVYLFGYDSNRGVRTAAVELSRRVENLAASGPIDIVAHSMGGLVARVMLEVDRRETDHIDQLILFAPPNASSSLADLSVESITESFAGRQGLLSEDRKVLASIDEQLRRCLGPVVEDLRAGSDLYGELSRTRRIDGVRYSILAGSGGPIDPTLVQTGRLLGALLGSAAQPDQRDEMHDAVDALLDTTDRPEWLRGSGDGVVSVDQTRLPGVSDFEVLDVSHNCLTHLGQRGSLGEEAARVAAEIRERLAR